MLADAADRLRPTDRVLEIGCGTGSIAIRLAPHAGEWTATDFSPEMLRIARAKPAPKNLRFVLADAGSAFDGGPSTRSAPSRCCIWWMISPAFSPGSTRI